jgi:hypothetical protein
VKIAVHRPAITLPALSLLCHGCRFTLAFGEIRGCQRQRCHFTGRTTRTDDSGWSGKTDLTVTDSLRVGSGLAFLQGSIRFITMKGDFTVTADNRVWIGQDGQQFGPYSEADIRQWMREGRLSADALAWREGMTDWASLASLFVTTASTTPPPPPPAGMPPLAGGAPWTHAGANHGLFGSGNDAARVTLPAPPSLPWGLVLLFSVLTLGIFGVIWPFIQASWVRKIDNKSNATLMLGLSIACFFIGEPLYVIGILSDFRSGHVGGGAFASLGGLLLLGRWILSLVAYFSMAGSVKRALAARGAALEIGGVTLFFFTLFYLQANLGWVARWKNTGQTSPKPSKGVFWAIFLLLPLLLGILVGISISA